jgi:hypothetical protein
MRCASRVSDDNMSDANFLAGELERQARNAAVESY